MSKYNVSFSKALGQNFLINPSVCPKMAEYALYDSDMCAIEIGPGIGVLTVELAKRAKKVIAIELDNSLIPLLDETLSDYENVKILNDDVLNINLNDLIKNEFAGENICICANLPYYITSQIIMKILESNLPIKNMVVMLQKEVADRLCAVPGSKNVGAITISTLYYAKPKVLFKVSKGSFMPMPKVDSSVIELKIRKKRYCNEEQEYIFKQIVKYAFSQRRKTILNSLSSGFNLPKDIMSGIIYKSNISPFYRAEQLSLNDFLNITFNLKEYYEIEKK